MELRKWELNSWDVLVKEIINSFYPSLLSQKDRSAFSSRIFEDKPFISSKQAQYKPPYSSRSKSGETFKKK